MGNTLSNDFPPNLKEGWWQQLQDISGAAFFASSAATIFMSIAFTTSIRANAPSTPVFVLMGVCAIVPPLAAPIEMTTAEAATAY
jgi:hypothetical protein